MTDGSRITLLEEWMKDKEGENLEFKSARGGFHFEELGKYCCALANEGGGRIILGVTDARPRQVVGTKAFDQPERTRKGLCERIPLAIDFEEINHPDCPPDSRVLVFNVPPRPLGIRGLRPRWTVNRRLRMTHNDAKMTQTILVQLVAKPRLAGVCRGRANSRLTQYDAKPCNRLQSNEHVDLEVNGVLTEDFQ